VPTLYIEPIIEVMLKWRHTPLEKMPDKPMACHYNSTFGGYLVRSLFKLWVANVEFAERCYGENSNYSKSNIQNYLSQSHQSTNDLQSRVKPPYRYLLDQRGPEEFLGLKRKSPFCPFQFDRILVPR
jgi:hypothetical protein